MSTLNELVTLANSIEDKIYESAGYLTPELENELAMTGKMLKEKIDAYGMVLGGLKNRGEYAKNRMTEWMNIVERCEIAEESLRNRIMGAMKSMDMMEIHGFEFTAAIQANPPKVKIVDEKLIPGEYFTTTTTTTVNKRDILDTIKEGRQVPGADIERGERLVLKTSQRRIEK